jgi:hypothetical protein
MSSDKVGEKLLQRVRFRDHFLGPPTRARRGFLSVARLINLPHRFAQVTFVSQSKN